jgi:hypothetical protein
MKTIFYNFLYSLIFFQFVAPFCSIAQSVIKGKVTDPKGKPVPFVNVFVKNSISGASTDTLGFYQIKTKETGNHFIAVSAIGYDTISAFVILENGKEYVQDFKLKEKVTNLGEVTISAGSFDADNDRKIAVLRPIDIYTTASAAGDIVGAIQTLPGTMKVSDQTGLFVRGGDASESATIVDDMVVQDPFFSDVPGIAQRSRFSPFQFKGVSFSSGGYSARYGQALSGVLELNTNDLPEKTTLSLNLNLAGASVSGAKLWKNQSFEATINYTNLTPFYGLVKTNYDVYNPPIGLGASAKWVWTNSNHDILKTSVNYSGYSSGIDVVNPEMPDSTLQFDLKNTYGIGSVYYKHYFTEKTYSTISGSYSSNDDNVSWGGLPYEKTDWRAQGRAELLSDISENVFGFIGTEVQRYDVNQTSDTSKFAYQETQAAAYAEAEWKPVRWLGIKPGIRYEYSRLLNRGVLAPRLAAAVKVSEYGQISIAGGVFYQNPEDKYLLVGERPNFQQAVHYIANYQYSSEDRTFRVEGYYKSYNQLVRELYGTYDPNPYRIITSPVDNSGHGYAQGIDVFWKDKASIKNLDYWVSYSYIDTKRLYENFPVMATPTFVSKNNLNLVAKYSIGKTGFMISGTYSFATGRPYYDPTSNQFLSETSPVYQNLAISLNYIFTIKKVFGVVYISGDNVTNYHNIMGYRYPYYPPYDKYPIIPAMYRSVFVGISLSLTPFKKEDL